MQVLQYQQVLAKKAQQQIQHQGSFLLPRSSVGHCAEVSGLIPPSPKYQVEHLVQKAVQ